MRHPLLHPLRLPDSIRTAALGVAYDSPGLTDLTKEGKEYQSGQLSCVKVTVPGLRRNWAVNGKKPSKSSHGREYAVPKQSSNMLGLLAGRVPASVHW